MEITRTRYARSLRALQRLLARNDGVVLLWALLIMFVLLITTAAAAQLVTSNEAAFGRDNTSVSALDISEAGIASAFAAIKASSDTVSSLAANGTLGGGSWSYTATRTQSTTNSTQYTWTVSSTGTQGASTHTVVDSLAQTIISTSQTSTQTTTTPASSAYGYGVFLGAGTSDCSAYSPSGPQNTLSGSGTINTSVYVAGSLCLSGGSQIQEPSSSTGGTLSLYVGGKLMTSNEASAVGTASKPLKWVDVVGGCVDGNHTTTTGSKKNPPIVTTYDPVPCSQQGTPLTCVTSCSGYGSGVYAISPPTGPGTGYSSSQTTITKPTIDTNWYSNAEPGPAHGCNSYGTGTSFYPSGWTATKFDQTVFDNDTTRNTSLSGAPTSGSGQIDFGQIVNRSGSGHAANSFDCRFYDSSGNLLGELAFNYPASGSESSSNPGILTINGTVFIDGSLDFGGNDYIEYQGVGTIYVNGTVTVENGASLCAVPISGSPCKGNFNPSQNLLEIVAINAGNAATGWNMSGAGNFEGIAFTNGNYNGGNGSALNGPVIADTGTFSGANSDQDTFTPPAGAPGAAATTTTTTTTSGPDQVSFASDPGSWQQTK